MLNRTARETSHLLNSSWSTSSENICSAAFSKDGYRFFAVSWTKLWIGNVEWNKWMLKASGDHPLVCTPNYVVSGVWLMEFRAVGPMYLSNLTSFLSTRAKPYLLIIPPRTSYGILMQNHPPRWNWAPASFGLLSRKAKICSYMFESYNVGIGQHFRRNRFTV